MPRVARSCEGSCEEARRLCPRVWGGSVARWHLHLGRPVSRTVTAHVSVVLSHLFCSPCYGCSRKPMHWCFPSYSSADRAYCGACPGQPAALGGVQGWPSLCPSRSSSCKTQRAGYRFLPALLLGEFWLARGHRASWTGWAVAWRKLRTWHQADVHADPDLAAPPPCDPGQVPSLPSSWFLRLQRRSKVYTSGLWRQCQKEPSSVLRNWWQSRDSPLRGCPVTPVHLHLQG